MSCQIKLTANIADVPAVRRHLFPTDDNRGSESWLQSCHISMSPTGDVLALAHNTRLAVLTGKWDSSTSCNQFHTSQESSFASTEEPIKSVLCLPIVIQSQSSQVGPDWTCITVGFESGTVGFYMEDCTLLVSEQLHDEPIVALKCQSQHSPRPDVCRELKPEELYVIYPSNICVISGTQLFPTLRNARSQLARGQSMVDELNLLQLLNPKKWGFTDQAAVNDATVAGLDLSNTFNHLLTASTCGGFESKYRAMPPHNTLVLGAGSKPFLGFHYALEGGAQPVFSDMAKAVANKLKSALPGWLTGGKSQVTEKQQTISMQPIEPMGCRFGLCDLRRCANQVVLSPDRRLAAVSDSMGRVLLIDTQRGIVLRIFKGYREAQCAFLQVRDERKSKSAGKTRRALFLVIYSGKKGSIEIFGAQQGTKIASFTASKLSKLLYIGHGLMGFQVTTKSRFICQYTCLLMDPDGKIKEVVIPFHFSLTEKNSKRARDVHLYKRLKQFIKTGDYKTNEELLKECLNTCSELKTQDVQLLFIEMLSSCKELTPEILISCTENIIERCDGTSELKTICINLLDLSKFYHYLDSLEYEANGNVAQSDLNLDKREMINLQRLLDLSTYYQPKQINKVKFSPESQNIKLSDFLVVFDRNRTDIKLKSGASDAELFKVSEKMFKFYINGHWSDEDFTRMKETPVYVKDVFRLLLVYWIHRDLSGNADLEREMENFRRALLALASRKGLIEDLVVEYNRVSEFWNGIREILADSPKPFPALMAAILCKNVACTVERNVPEFFEGDVWEELSQESCQWTLLIGKLEDISLLNIILAIKLNANGDLPKLEQLDRTDVSLKFVLEKGKASVGEIVAQWVAAAGVNPSDLVANDLNELDQFEQLNVLRKQFPYSLEPSVLLANMCWEYALSWQKNVQNLGLLKAALQCLNQIPNLHIRAGLSNLVWNTHLKILFESACKLINKVGKLPTERLCRQDTDLTDYQITLFMETCSEFFDSFMEALCDSCNYQKPTLKYEAIWENGNNNLPLTELALGQSGCINYDLLHLHFQLTTCIHMMTVFTVKHSKIISNMFDASVSSHLFSDFLGKVNVIHHKCDSKTAASRLQFLIKIISATLETVTFDESTGMIYSADHVAWMAKCIALARVWNLDVDLLKRYQVVQIYSNGFDVLGNELLVTVTERSKLGPELVCVAGRRLNQLLAKCDDLGSKIAAFSTSLTKYLGTLNGGDWCESTDLRGIINLVTNSLNCMTESQPEYRMAKLMMDACKTMQDFNL
ncbi:PREDICTED: rab3 GTPase-activating protein regulatory subunit [Nicrophorus vespilloides]|uniref:Rab3 GTPase-activating protein regulatory subunit n=1 Tax=Nicrophorus vespilloides TaxID=110193 RepID=A0ABM1NCN8_NICVS|nr:PREDICTED: rab3 GTPase-activating protein regulatory subunit [Nicrophorus vespilloides]